MKNKYIVCFCTMGIAVLIIIWLFQSKINFKNSNVVNDPINQAEIVEESLIYQVINQSFMLVDDPTNLKNIITENSIIAKIQVLKIEESKNFASLKENDDYFYPDTPVKVLVKEVIKGEKLTSKEITIYNPGGVVLIKDLIPYYSLEKQNKMNLTNLSDHEKNNMYVKFQSEYDYPLVINKEYIIIFSKNSDGRYVINARGFAIFETNDINLSSKSVLDTKVQKSYKNVLSNNSLELSK